MAEDAVGHFLSRRSSARSDDHRDLRKFIKRRAGRYKPEPDNDR